MQKRRQHGLLNLPVRFQIDEFLLDAPRLVQLALDDRVPLLRLAFVWLDRRDLRQLTPGFGDTRVAGRAQEHVGADKRRRIPFLGFAQRERKGSQHASRALKPLKLRPFRIQDFRQIRMEGVARQETLFGVLSRLLRFVVQHFDAVEGLDDGLPEAILVLQRLRREESSPQHLGHILLSDRLDAFFALAAEDRVEVVNDVATERVILGDIRGQERRDDRALVDFGGCLRQSLEEILQALAPCGVGVDRPVGEHQHFIQQEQRGPALFLRRFEHRHQQVLGGRCAPLLRLIVLVQQAEAVSAGELPGQRAPGLAEHAPVAGGVADFDTFFDIELVEGQHRHPSGRQRHVDAGFEFVDGREVWE